MNDLLLNQLQQRKSNAQQRIEELSQEIGCLDQAMACVSDLDPAILACIQGTDQSSSRRSLSSTQVITEFLQGQQNPRSVHRIGQALKEAEFQSREGNFARIASTTLRRRKDLFVRQSDGRWTLVATETA